MEKGFRQGGIPSFLNVQALRSGIYKCLQRQFRIKKGFAQGVPKPKPKTCLENSSNPREPKKHEKTKKNKTNKKKGIFL